MHIFNIILTCKMNFSDVYCWGMAVFAPRLLQRGVCTQPVCAYQHLLRVFYFSNICSVQPTRRRSWRIWVRVFKNRKTSDVIINMFIRSFAGTVSASVFFPYHCQIANEDCPYVGACFRNHKHTNQRHGICPKYNGNIKSKAENDCQPHIFKIFVLIFFGAFIK